MSGGLTMNASNNIGNATIKRLKIYYNETAQKQNRTKMKHSVHS